MKKIGKKSSKAQNSIKAIKSCQQSGKNSLSLSISLSMVDDIENAKYVTKNRKKKINYNKKRKYDSFAMKARKKREVVKRQQALREYRKKFGTTERKEKQPTERPTKRDKKGKKGHWYDKVLEKRKAEQDKKQEELKERKKEVKREQKKRRRTHAKLSKRTTRGQPVMKHAIEHMLKKIRKIKRDEENQ